MGEMTTSAAAKDLLLILGLSTAVIGLQFRRQILNFLFSTNKHRLSRKDSYYYKNDKENNQSDTAGVFTPAYLEKHPAGFGEMKLMDNVQILKSYLLPVPHLSEVLEDANDCHVLNYRSVDVLDEDLDEDISRKSTYNKLMGPTNVILGDIRRQPCVEPTPESSSSRAYLRAGPRRHLFYYPTEVNAAVVTCGGLCPGLNNVIRDLTLSLWNLYGVRKIYGIKHGFHGFWDPHNPPMMLNPSTVSGIHHEGGTILGSNRGGFDVDKILNFVETKNVSQLYVIGGDGTHRAANIIAKTAIGRNIRLSVAGIPKTIDNDVDLLDRSFGFNTAVEEAQRAIRCAKTEAHCVPNGVGIVKLMGRSAGFIAAHATLSSGDVNLCLVPEVPIVLTGKNSCLTHIERVIDQKENAVIVVAEGAGEEHLSRSTEVDAGGNRKLPAIGEFLKQKVVEHFKKAGKPVTVKYIDPSYMVRSGPANAADSLYCMLLAQNAVHGAMAGYTSFTVGLCCNRMVFLPIDAVTRNSPRCMDPYGRTWERVLCLTRQPNTVGGKDISTAVTSDPPI